MFYIYRDLNGYARIGDSVPEGCEFIASYSSWAEATHRLKLERTS